MNTEVRLKLELSEAQMEIQRLRQRLTTTPPLSTKIFLWYPAFQNGQVRNQPAHGRNFSPNIKGSAGIGHWWETDCLQVVVLGLVDNVRTFYKGEDVLWQNFGTTFRKNVKPALRGYECQGVGHFGRECPTRQRRRGKSKNSPGKNDPTERLKSQGVRLNPGL